MALSRKTKILLNKINKYDEDNIKFLIDELIKKELEYQKEDACGIRAFGYVPNINYKKQLIPNENASFFKEELLDEEKYAIVMQSIIPEDLPYVIEYEEEFTGYGRNKGHYYYNRHNTIYEFAKYVKGQKIDTDDDFIEKVYNFTINYFTGVTKDVLDRSIITGTLESPTNRFYEHCTIRTVEMFKKNNTAKCTEYALFAQNILRIFGYDIYIMHGSLLDENDNEKLYVNGEQAILIHHAFNIIRIGKDYYILDFSSSIGRADLYYEDGISSSYFLCPIGVDDKTELNNMINSGCEIVLDDYDVIDTGKSKISIKSELGRKRKYIID